MLDIFLKILAGFGMFMAGFKLIDNNMSQLTSRRVKAAVEKCTGHTFFAGMWGLFFGAVAISTSAITYTIVSMVSAGILTVQAAMPIINWCNPGSCLLFIVAFLDIKTIILLLIGVSGILYSLEKPEKYINLIISLFGLGLIFYGIELMSEGALPMKDAQWFQSMLGYTKSSPMLAFLIGSFLAFAVQSIDAFLIIVLTLAKVGAISIEQTIMFIYAAHVGEAAINWMLSLSLKGTSKQLAMFQVLNGVVGTAIFLPLFYIESFFNVPLAKSFITANDLRLEQQMANLILLYNVVVSIALSIFSKPVSNMLEKIWPHDETESEGALKFLDMRALKDPPSAFTLLAKEQSRLIKKLPDYIIYLRNKFDESDHKIVISEVHKIFIKLSAEIDYFLSELTTKNLDKQCSVQLINYVNRQNLISSLEDNLFNLTETIYNSNMNGEFKKIVHNFIEGLDAILLTASDAFASGEELETDILINITADKGDLMDNLRTKYIGAQQELQSDEKVTLLFIIEQFEKSVWLMRKLAILIKNEVSEA
ncbi:MAG: Na/Pi symporter [Candidatus Wallbacteria bacterium]